MMTSHERPRLRDDLVAEAIEDQGARFIDVIDPDTGSAYRFYDVEYSLACAMDGERDIPGLVRWAQEELGLSPSPGELRTVISTLGELGYLSPEAVAREAARDALTTPVGMPAVEPEPASAPAPGPASGISVELGRFEAPPPEPVAVAAPALELGAAGPGSPAAPGAAAAEFELGPAGHVVEDLPTPDSSRVPTRPSVPRASRPKLGQPQRPSEPALGADPRRASERDLADAGRRPSEQALPPRPEAKRPSEQALRANALGPVAPLPNDPSLNLSLPIRPDDVKEAVRASREMRSVDVPAELMQALEGAERPEPRVEPRRRAASSVPPPAGALVPALPPLPEAVAAVPSVATTPSATLAAVKPSPAVLDPISPLPGASVSVSEPLASPAVPPLMPVPRDTRPEARVEAKPPALAPVAAPMPALESRPALVPVPRETPPAATAVPTPAPRRSNGLFIGILVLAIVAVVGVIVWKFVLHKSAPKEAAPTPAPAAQPPTAAAPPEVPAAPPPITTKLTLAKPSAVTVKMPAAGVLQSVVADGTEVQEGDAIATLGGAKSIEQRIAAIKGDLDKRYPEDLARIKANLEKAVSAADRAKYTAELNRRNARIAQRTEELKKEEAALAKLSVQAPLAGKVTPMAKAGARLAADAEVASIEPASFLKGATDLRKAGLFAVGDSIELRQKDGDAKITCTVKIVQDSKIEIACPVTDGFSDGTELLYVPGT